MINKVTLVGRLGQDAKLAASKDGRKFASFSVATNEKKKSPDGTWKDSVEWHDVMIFDPIASALSSYLVKGKMVYIEGKLTTHKYDDKNGVTHYRTKILSSLVKILDVEKRDTVVNEAPQTKSNSRQVDNSAPLFFDDECPF